MMEVTVRPAHPEDAHGIASVHVAAWQTAYRDMMPDDYLGSLSVGDRADYWRTALSGPMRPQGATLVAVDRSAAIVGFAVVGPAAGEGSHPVGELYAMNVDPSAWGSGAGTTLLAAATEALADVGFGEAVLWVHPENRRARAFYEKSGWQVDDLHRVERVLGVEVPEIRYSRSLDDPRRPDPVVFAG